MRGLLAHPPVLRLLPELQVFQHPQQRRVKTPSFLVLCRTGALVPCEGRKPAQAPTHCQREMIVLVGQSNGRRRIFL